MQAPARITHNNEGDSMKTLFSLTLLAASLPAHGAQTDVLPVKQIGLELARDIAMASVEACRKDGYNVSAVVLDRAGNVQAACATPWRRATRWKSPSARPA
jgi:hypothetical protein